MVLLVDALLSHIDLVYGFGGWVDNLSAESCLPNANSILVDKFNELAALVNCDFGILLCHN